MYKLHITHIQTHTYLTHTCMARIPIIHILALNVSMYIHKLTRTHTHICSSHTFRVRTPSHAHSLKYSHLRTHTCTHVHKYVYKYLHINAYIIHNHAYILHLCTRIHRHLTRKYVGNLFGRIRWECGKSVCRIIIFVAIILQINILSFIILSLGYLCH